ncbi:MAG TPA: NADH-quinone oxidoreductase subunit N [Armatimonadota bacterium]|nr:NADH-quinone oxidoreductase subunit N [Armatimonadota bacterium]HOM83465.1 NADH-quinone oxidoreductase subunit N [Armatimonadota bacterium]HPO73090.1 NADH-quinone oxidoreductase subunit N [Armatimonadota bacterium]
MSSAVIDIRWFWVAPELVLTFAGLAGLLAAAMRTPWARHPFARPAVPPEDAEGTVLRAAEWICIVGVAVAGLLAAAVGWSTRALHPGVMVHFWGGMMHDPFSAFFKVAVAVATLLVMAMTAAYRRSFPNRPEMYALLTLATLAIFFMASASELVVLFLAVEFLSIVSYVLVGYLKNEPRSAEAGIKYFLFGTVCSAVMLYGMSLLYGLTGSTLLQGIAGVLAGETDVARRMVVLAAAFFVLAGLGFKVSMAPFHQWVPDAYEGAPTPITAYLSVASKAAGFAVTVRFLGVALALPQIAPHWAALIAILAMITMTWGNTAAIWQTNIKRMLAYSSIAQAGYILTGLAAAGVAGEGVREFAIPGILLYVLAYLFMNLGAFAVVIAVANQDGVEEIPGYAGLARRAPWLAAAMTIFLLSLIGIPPTAGFIAKLYLFLAAIKASTPLMTTLAVVMFVNSVISAYYYLNVVRQMYLGEPVAEKRISAHLGLKLTVGVCAVATIAILIAAEPFLALSQDAVYTSTPLFSILIGRFTW